MAVKIRLQRRGRKKRPFYHIVVADERAPRDGRFIEKLGTYNPMTKPATIELDRDRAFDWLMKGAQPTDTARAILRFKGILYKKHLQRGVTKGALTQEQADELYAQWVTDKENKIRDRVNETAAERASWYEALSGTAKPIVVKEEPAEEAAEEAPAAETAEEAPAAEAAEEAPAAEATEEAPAAEATEEAPAVEATEEAPAEEATEEAPAEEATEEAPAVEATEEAPAEEATEEAPAAEATEEAPAEEATEEAPAEEATEEAPAAEAAEEATEEEAPAEEEKTEDEDSEEKE